MYLDTFNDVLLNWLVTFVVTVRSGLVQATYNCMPLSPSSIIWYRSRG